MSYGDRFMEAFQQHQKSLTDLEETLRTLDVDLLANQNIQLSEENKRIHTEMTLIEEKNRQLAKDLQSMREAYREQLLSEKMGYFKGSKKRIDALYEASLEGTSNKLTQIEVQLNSKISGLATSTEKLGAGMKSRYMLQINELERQMMKDMASLHLDVAASREAIGADIANGYDAVGQNVIGEERIEQMKRRNNFELKLGLNLINKLGVILIFLAVILAGRYSYTHWFNAYAKGISFYGLGLLFLTGGEILTRKRMSVVAAGVTGGGIGILYGSTFISTFHLNILTFNMAMGIALLITLTSLTLTVRYKSPVIGSLSLIGGYLPVFAYTLVFGIANLPVMQAIMYLMVFNILVLVISIRHKWSSVILVGFVMNMPCIHGLLYMMDAPVLAIVMAYANFIVYLAVPLYRSIKERINLGVLDVGVISINTLANCAILYHLFDKAGLQDFYGVLALVHAVTYFVIATQTGKKNGNPAMINTFYTFAIALSVLVVPLQLSYEWIFLGWIMEACLYVYLGRMNRIKALERMGLGLLVLGHMMLIVFDIGLMEALFNNGFGDIDFKYACLIASEVFVVWVYHHFAVKEGEGDASLLAVRLRYPVAVHATLFLVYEAVRTYEDLMSDIGVQTIEMVAIICLVVAGFNMLLTKFHAEKVIRLIDYKDYSELLILGILVLINYVGFDSTGIRWWIDACLLVAGNGLVLWRGNRFLATLETRDRITDEQRTLTLGVYALASYCINLFGVFRPENLSLVLNMSAILFAIVYIVIGFRKNMTLLRRLGLGLSVAATFKMLVIDSLSFSLPQKIVSYFVFGLILIAISIVYQKITARLTGNGEV